MFIELGEMRTVVYPYQMQQIAENNDQDIVIAINTAIEEVKSYLSRYDIGKIFTATIDERNPLICEITKTIALWYLMQKSNVDMQFDNLKDRYDRAINYLRDVENGKRQPDLPIATNDSGEQETMFRYGSNPKFNDPTAY